MTETDDRLARLFREPLTAERDEAFAARLKADIAAARLTCRIYQAVTLAAAVAILIGAALAVSSLTAAFAQAAGDLVQSTFGSPLVTVVLMGVAAALAIPLSQWLARRPA